MCENMLIRGVIPMPPANSTTSSVITGLTPEGVGGAAVETPTEEEEEEGGGG
jgi:hypothetical protein